MCNQSDKAIPFPLDDVKINQVDQIPEIEDPLYSNNWMSISPVEFSMTVENVGSFYAGGGNRIEYSPDKKADEASLELYMNGSIYGAILHQRQILPLHGSSFIFNHSGVMFCGDSGAGKSSLTTSFCLNGAGFLTDDVTPILFKEEKPHIWPKSGKIKLWDDSLQQLSREKQDLTKIRPEDEKYYLEIESNREEAYPLHTILILQVTEDDEVSFEKVQKVEAFSYLHQEIYRREYLFAMPDAESDYLKKISAICNEISIFRVNRPISIQIDEMRKIVSKKVITGNL
ncbi:hypothetical protein [Rhodohalobacter sulfatireducens]|uniref:HPr kinase/phosphorylase C-terminal domain-containing protein n=1 Tax=Rhodohalobacter sulfatireducens TaxID=2911366 RepID=A0ABS9KHF4_9BACT|nr:hypothetical protein [Rhodohalobacter sulfatireducens]MCG2590289.1 hypothetical protein [Rhodohalobacter sulfatireducens]